MACPKDFILTWSPTKTYFWIVCPPRFRASYHFSCTISAQRGMWTPESACGASEASVTRSSVCQAPATFHGAMVRGSIWMLGKLKSCWKPRKWTLAPVKRIGRRVPRQVVEHVWEENASYLPLKCHSQNEQETETSEEMAIRNFSCENCSLQVRYPVWVPDERDEWTASLLPRLQGWEMEGPPVWGPVQAEHEDWVWLSQTDTLNPAPSPIFQDL